MAASVLDLLLRLSLAGALAVTLALLVRRPVRALFGAQAACLAWLLVPAMLFASAVPPMQVREELAPLAFALEVPSVAGPAAAAAFDWRMPLLTVWLCGALAALTLMARAQRHFVARLGALQRRGALWFASTVIEGPALLGLFDPRIVLPYDFCSRYDPSEQALVIAHEQCHALRRDPLANACAALLQCAFWFNPLMHYAAARYRFDRELACDAEVMGRHPGRAKQYAAAMLKTADGDAFAFAACHWQSSHPLKERIMHLKKPVPSFLRRKAGRLLALSLAFAGASAAVVANADPSAAGPARYAVSMTLEGDGHDASPLAHVRDGEHFTVSTSHGVSGQEQSHMSSAMTVSGAGPGMVKVGVRLKLGDDTLAEPTLRLKLGETGALRVDGKGGKVYKMSIMVDPIPSAKAGV